MQENEILLSICIPTYNRSQYLIQTLDSIVRQDLFISTNSVEIVISDNASTDDTNLICSYYEKKYNGKITYHRNSDNILDLNFEKVLSLGVGRFLKLNNDTLTHHNGSLAEIILHIQNNINTKPVLFYTNGLLKKIDYFECSSLNSFIEKSSFYSTWIGAFGIWKDDFNQIVNFNRFSNLHLVQVDVLYRLIVSGKKVNIYNCNLFESILPQKKGGYNIFKVFVENYLEIIEYYKKINQVKYNTLFNEKTKLLFHQVVPWYLNLLSSKTSLGFVNQKSFLIIFNKYKFHPLFLFGIIYFFMRLPYHFIKLNVK